MSAPQRGAAAEYAWKRGFVNSRDRTRQRARAAGWWSGSIRPFWHGWRRPSIADDHGSGGRAGVPGAGATDMRKGFDGLSLLAQEVLVADPFSGHLFVFRGKRGDLIKVLYWDGQVFLACSPSGWSGDDSSGCGRGGRGGAEPGAARDAARGDRPEGAAAHRSSDLCGLTIQYLVSSRYKQNEVAPIEGVLLPDDPEALRALIAAQAAELAARAGLVAKALEIETPSCRSPGCAGQAFGRSLEKPGRSIEQPLELSLEDLRKRQA